MDYTDEEIAKQIAVGNQKVFEMIFEHYKTPILNFSLRMLGNRADAEDVVSDVFLVIFAKKYTYTANAKFTTWLFTIARNNCIDKIRKRKNLVSMWFSKNQNDEEDQWDIPDSSEHAREKLDKKDMSQAIKLAVSRLPLDQKEAIVLREYHGLTYEDISQILSCSLEKVKILIFRAREHLKIDLASVIKEAHND